jgi:hypothetical protein
MIAAHFLCLFHARQIAYKPQHTWVIALDISWKYPTPFSITGELDGRCLQLKLSYKLSQASLLISHFERRAFSYVSLKQKDIKRRVANYLCICIGRPESPSNTGL